MGAWLGGACIINQRHEVVEADRCFADMLGYAPEELLRLHTWDGEAALTEEEIRPSPAVSLTGQDARHMVRYMGQHGSGGGGVPAGPDPALIRFATFNVRYGSAADGPNHWDLRKGILLDAVGALDVHVMGVQECMPFQGDEIKMRFPSLDRVGVGRYHGVPIESRPQESRSGEHCDIFYDSRRYLVETCGTFWHSDTPDAPGSISWSNPYPRITTWAILRSRAGSGRFAFFCTHYHGGEPCCTKATDLMIDRIRGLAGTLPCVVVGDFNLTPDNRNHGRLTDAGPGGLGLRDVWQFLGKSEQDAGTCHDFDGKPKTRIDWILTGGELTPVSVERSFYQRGGRFPSDHFPLVAQFARTGALSP